MSPVVSTEKRCGQSQGSLGSAHRTVGPGIGTDLRKGGCIQRSPCCELPDRKRALAAALLRDRASFVVSGGIR
jgi:hypothetical protein